MVWRGDRHLDAAPVESHVEDHEILADDDFDASAERKLFAAGWFRALLVLTALAVAVVVASPYLLDWFDLATSSPRTPPAPDRREMAAAPAPSPILTGTAAKTVVPGHAVLPHGPLISPSSETATRRLPPAKTAGAKRSEPRKAAPSDTAAQPSGSHWVQLGLFKDAQNADQLARRLRNEGFSVQVASVSRNTDGTIHPGTYHVVRAGAFADQAKATAARDDLKTRGYDGFLTEGAAK